MTESAPFPHSAWLAELPGGLRRRFQPGEAIARPGDGPDRLFVLDAGLARICLNGAARELTIGYLRPGGIYVTHTRAWIEALAPSTVVSWPVSEMLALVTRQPALGLAAFREVGQLLHGAMNLIEDLAFRPVESRLARFLLGERRLQHSDRIRLIDSTESLASALGTSRQTLSTLINKLIREGVLARPDRRHLALCDIARLEELAELSAG
ncbi:MULTISPECIES: Crp/Fnr family transcriptional regulator [Rhodovulum]|uniref:CRP-like cAMP-binding protein n=2 Tax=Rhodovulum TaxID=34008 RepID=A0A8E2VN75_9RHOB|nr:MULTISPECIES: Crp/Fnr family transcriptional regulator [Rhodovulum]PTW52197.1 CRP-like cAMP-binding protein [Rhodovulum kholense]RAP43344.1 Crp/Fnr family transcriptional regulator [Rhodovulum viride]